MLARAAASCAALALLSAAAPTVRAQAPAAVKTAIQAMYTRSDAAAVKKDVDGVLAPYAPNFTATDVHGKTLQRAELAAQLRMMIPNATSIASRTTVESIALKGSTAIVTALGHMKIVGQNPGQPGQPATFDMTVRSKDTWVKGAHGWLCTTSRNLMEKNLMNGKPLPGM